MQGDRKIQVQMQHTKDLSEVNILLYTEDGTALTGQDILDAVAETLLYQYDNYDLEAEQKLDS